MGNSNGLIQIRRDTCFNIIPCPIRHRIMFAAYNTLPTVDIADEHAERLSSVRQKLSNLLQEYQLQNVFGIRLVHKHFDMLEGELPVFSRIPVTGVTPVIIMRPLPSSNLSQYTPKNFLVHHENLIPYEFSTSTSRIDISQYQHFIDRVVKVITEENANHIFGLVAFPDEDSDDALSEFELPELRTTVMVPPSLLPSAGTTKEIPTNWKAPHGYSPTATVAAYCGSRSDKHVKVSGYCQFRQTFGHTRVSPIGPEGTPSNDSEIILQPGSLIARVVVEVQSCVAVAG
ncbi:hypothetical protein AN958_08092 [Leucoagaricus sp. SymC.cos]|nr:hypothetical protein AN958_08092 [Leucoagaricus sp. SymC.cos]